MIAILTMTDNHVMGDGKFGVYAGVNPIYDLVKEVTKNSVVIIGSTTWIVGSPEYHESAIPVVLSKSPDKVIGCNEVIADDPIEILSYIKNKYPTKQIVVLGGLNIFCEFLSFCHDFYINRVCCDAQGTHVFSNTLHNHVQNTSCLVKRKIVHDSATRPRVEMYHYRRSIH